MRTDDELLDLLGRGLRPATPPEPTLRELMALEEAVRFPREAPGRRFRLNVNRQTVAALLGAGILATSGTAYAFEQGHVPDPVRAVAHAVGLPVESTGEHDARLAAQRLRDALSQGGSATVRRSSDRPVTAARRSRTPSTRGRSPPATTGVTGPRPTRTTGATPAARPTLRRRAGTAAPTPPPRTVPTRDRAATRAPRPTTRPRPRRPPVEPFGRAASTTVTPDPTCVTTVSPTSARSGWAATDGCGRVTRRPTRR